jgi:hypothetical protein
MPLTPQLFHTAQQVLAAGPRPRSARQNVLDRELHPVLAAAQHAAGLQTMRALLQKARAVVAEPYVRRVLQAREEHVGVRRAVHGHQRAQHGARARRPLFAVQYPEAHGAVKHARGYKRRTLSRAFIGACVLAPTSTYASHMSQQIAPLILNLDLPAIWDNYCSVLLPLGPPTLSTIIPASMKLFVPFFVFVTALFMHLYGIWTRENSSAALVDGGDEAAPMMMR